MKRINAEMEAASCQPRDTVLDSYEEIGIPKGYSTFIFPGCVVVKRCKHGGCCRDDEECVPVQHAREEVSMLVSYIISLSSSILEPLTMLTTFTIPA